MMPAMTESRVPDYESMPDAELMAQVRRGRRDAFLTLVRRHEKPLLNFFRNLGVYNDAEDLAQDTFLRVYRYRKRYKPKAKFTTFLYLLARQVRIDMLRKLRRREELAGELREHAEADEAERRERREPETDVDELLQSLPDGMREVVVLNIYQGLRYQEISDVLDIPVGTVKSRMFHALRNMKERLEKQ